ncbi:serine hydrolase domain-containing protein [Winogradskya humida]|uniref:Serine hydrolase n=1 Tax=Winogradskya humida TaxID=113566 RepID=A0ABQ4A5I2_9ACTN|nr:serine hydrolase domain-containing protein [Actinoplanes humidus]GIE25612.1 serine hydrolase [Actinoplanes humidus]
MPLELLPGTRRALLHKLATAQVQGRVPSIVAAVIRDGDVVWSDARGTVNGDVPDGNTQYRIGSITKTFVAVLVLRLRDAGRLALTDPFSLHLPGVAPDGITIRDLLAHTAGLACESPGPWWERTPGTLRPELADVLGDDPLRHPVGERFHYSNPGYALLGALVSKLHDEPWDAVLQREILEPLGMTRTTPHPLAPHATGWAVHPWADVLLPEPAQDTGLLSSAGQLWSTTTDLARFAAFLLTDPAAQDMRIPSSPSEATSLDSPYGLGMQLLHRDGRLLAGHTGSMPGFLATVWVSPDDNLGAVVLSNTTTGLTVGTLTAELLQIVTDREPRIPSPWQPLASVDPRVLELAGPWYWGPQGYALRPLADGFVELASLTGKTGIRFRPTTAVETWEALNGYFAGEHLRVIRDAAGAVTHLDVGSFVFTRQPYDPASPIPGGVDPAGWQTAPVND